MKHVIRGTPPNDRLAAGLAQFVAAGSLRRFLFGIDKQVGSPLYDRLRRSF